jgi:integrase/recombinase XerD
VVRRSLDADSTAAELSETWLTAKRALESAAQVEKGHSDRARRADLGRWAIVITDVAGRSDGAHNDASDLESLRLFDLRSETVVAALAAAKARWSDATVDRMLSTLRGWCGWLQRAGHIDEDPTDDDMVRAPHVAQRRPRAVDGEDVARLLAEAATAYPPGPRMYWPTRDVALMRFMASTGARAEETCGALIGEIDRRAERPIWRVGTAKGSKTRDVPLSQATVAAVDVWLAERREPSVDQLALPARRTDPLFVRRNGTAFSPQALDRVVRGLAERSGVVLPAGAAAHAFRHHYGVTLALRGVPQSVISQLMGHADPRTTSIYTTVASTQLIAALDDAGLL